MNRWFTIAIAAALVLPVAARAQDGPIVLKATTVLDGKGGVTRNTAIVTQGSKIVRLDPNARGTTFDLSGLTVMLAVPVGLAFVGAGLVAWSQRPENRTGLLMTLVGFTWLGTSLLAAAAIACVPNGSKLLTLVTSA